MKIQLAFIILGLMVTQTNQIGFLEFIRLPLTWLRRDQLKEIDNFQTDGLSSLHKAAVTKFLETKKDGIKLTLNLVFYNFALNLQRQCLLNSFPVKSCDMFTEHVQELLKEAYANDDPVQQSKFSTISNLYDAIFDTTKYNPDNDEDKEVISMLNELNEYYNGPIFEEMKEYLLSAYNQNFEALDNFLNARANPIADDSIDNEQEKLIHD